MNAMRHTRPETPVSGIPHSMVQRIRSKYDTGAKIVDAIKRAIEMKTGGYVADEEMNQIMDTLLSIDVHSFSLLLTLVYNSLLHSVNREGYASSL